MHRGTGTDVEAARSPTAATCCWPRLLPNTLHTATGAVDYPRSRNGGAGTVMSSAPSPQLAEGALGEPTFAHTVRRSTLHPAKPSSTRPRHHHQSKPTHPPPPCPRLRLRPPLRLLHPPQTTHTQKGAPSTPVFAAPPTHSHHPTASDPIWCRQQHHVFPTRCPAGPSGPVVTAHCPFFPKRGLFSAADTLLLPPSALPGPSSPSSRPPDSLCVCCQPSAASPALSRATGPQPPSAPFFPFSSGHLHLLRCFGPRQNRCRAVPPPRPREPRRQTRQTRGSDRTEGRGKRRGEGGERAGRGREGEQKAVDRDTTEIRQTE